MKKIIPILFLAISASSSFLFAQDNTQQAGITTNYELPTTNCNNNQDAGYRLQVTGYISEELESDAINEGEYNFLNNQVSLLEGDSVPIFHLPSSISYLGMMPKSMMDPAELKPLEEGIENLRGVFGLSGESASSSRVVVNSAASSHFSVESSCKYSGSEELEESSSDELDELLAQAFEPQGKSESKASRVLHKIACCSTNVSEYLTQATNAREAGNLENAILWEKAAQQSEVAGEQWKKVIYENILLALKKLEHLEKNVSSNQETLTNESAKQQLEQKEIIAFWQKVAEQAGISADNDQLMIILEDSEDGFDWAEVGDSFKKSARSLSKALKYNDKASLAQTEGLSTLAFCWTQAAEKSQTAAEYYKKHAQLSMTEDREKNELFGRQYTEVNPEIAANTYKKFSKYWHNAAKVFNTKDRESAELWMRAAEQMQVCVDYGQANFEKREVKKMSMEAASTAGTSLYCVAKDLANAAEYSEQAFQAQGDLETATFFKRAKEQSEAASERAKESAQAYQLENRKKGNELVRSAHILRNSARCFADAASSHSIEAKQCMINAAEQWSKSSDAYKIGNTQEGCWLNKSAEYLKNSAYNLNRFSEYNRLLSKLAYADEVQEVDGAQKLSVQQLLDASSTGATQQFAAEVELWKESNEKVSQCQSSGHSEQALLLTQAAENLKIASEYNSKGSHAYELGNEEEGNFWRSKARSIEQVIFELAPSLRSLNQG